MLSDSNEEVRLAAAIGCGQIVEKDFDNQLEVRKAQGLAPLVQMLTSTSDYIREASAAAIRALVKGCSKIQNDLANLDCIKLLMEGLITSKSVNARIQIVGALMELARDHRKTHISSLL